MLPVLALHFKNFNGILHICKDILRCEVTIAVLPCFEKHASFSKKEGEFS